MVHETTAVPREVDIDDVVHFIVHEGDYTYPLSATTAGWGSLISGTRCARVVAVREEGNGGPCSVLAEAELRTDPSHPWRNRQLFHRARDALLAQGCLTIKGRPSTMPGRYRVPVVGPATHAWRLWSRLTSVAARRVRRYLGPRAGQWSIGILPREAFHGGPAFPWGLVRWTSPPADGFIADPFVVNDGAQTWVFYERLIFSEDKGTLWAARVDAASGSLREPREVLRTAFHLSFPHVFKDGDAWYMLPEQARSGSTTLYRAERFPDDWRVHRELLPNFPGIDPILHYHAGRWWLFVTFGLHPCNESNLYLFSANRLDDAFVAHPMNPIKTGLRGSRMAGPICMIGGRLMRLGQDCTERYGHRIVLFEITRLGADAYEEREMHTWQPDNEGSFRGAFHTFSMTDGVIAIDGQSA